MSARGLRECQSMVYVPKKSCKCCQSNQSISINQPIINYCCILQSTNIFYEPLKLLKYFDELVKIWRKGEDNKL